MKNEKYKTITKENINEMVITFYTNIINANNEVSKIFIDKIGNDLNSDTWVEHINIITNFWAMIALNDNEYNGNPLRPHFDLPIKKEMFGDWLEIFFKTVDSIYEINTGMIFKQRAENIAHNFMRNLSL